MLYLEIHQFGVKKIWKVDMQTDFDNDLLNYFTGVENLRDIFKEYVASQKLIKRLIVIHGIGGVGKSCLLYMFRLHCKSENVPVALASGLIHRLFLMS